MSGSITLQSNLYSGEITNILGKKLDALSSMCIENWEEYRGYDVELCTNQRDRANLVPRGWCDSAPLRLRSPSFSPLLPQKPMDKVRWEIALAFFSRTNMWISFSRVLLRQSLSFDYSPFVLYTNSTKLPFWQMSMGRHGRPDVCLIEMHLSMAYNAGIDWMFLCRRYIYWEW